MNRHALMAGCVLLACSSFGEVEVTSVTCMSRQPWNGQVDVAVALSGTEAEREYAVSLALILSDATELPVTTLRTEPIVRGDGRHVLVWDAAADYPCRRFADARIKATVTPFDGSQGLYLVFDLTEGASAASYPHRYSIHGPDLDSDVCRTTELWLRRMPAGTYMRGNPNSVPPDGSINATYLPYHQVKLTKPFYLGVFELTQQQYFQMEGAWPSYFSLESDRATRPLEKMSLQGFRGNNSQYGWYDDGTTLDESPLRRLREKTGFDTLDLPSSAQWEYACRAGYQNRYCRPDMTDANVATFTRNSQNVTVQKDDADPTTPASDGGTAKVGSFLPNPWGLYDMDGNVRELSTSGYPYASSLLPEFGDFASDLYVDPLGPTAEWCSRTGLTETKATGATMCGGSWDIGASAACVYYCGAVARSLSGGSQNYVGLRLCITCK